MHLFNSPVSLMTQTNWHEPCHLGTHCPSEAPRPLYLRAEKSNEIRVYQNLCIWKSHRWYHPSIFTTSHERPWELVLNRPKWPQLPLAFCLSLSLVPTFAGNEQANINSPYSCFWYTWEPSDWKHIPTFSNDNSEYEIGDAVPATFRCILNCCSTLIFRSKRGSHHWRALSSQKCHCKISPDT